MGKYNRILFLGFRCAGKTTISKKLSKIINIPLIDIDNEIEKEQKKTITEITNNGENWWSFRRLELEKLKEALQLNNVIISCGGGVGVNNVKYDNNLTYGDLERDLIMKSTNTLKVLLYTSNRALRQRLYLSKINKNNRPDLDAKTHNIGEYISGNIKILKEREESYRKLADIIFDASSKNILENTNNLLNIIKDYEIQK